jgi:hypothetical protein
LIDARQSGTKAAHATKGGTVIVIDELMISLARRRPLFCSEADFQHELAYEIRRNNPQLNIRLEWPLAPPARGAIDLVVMGETRFALELKYLSKSFSTMIDGEPVTLKQHGAHDQRRYDVCKDVARMEAFAEATGSDAGVLVLTNDPAYWQDRSRAQTIDAAFNLSHLRELTGTLAWRALAKPGTTKNREAALSIKGRYALTWHTYRHLEGPAGLFRYLWIPIAAPATD